MVVIIGKNAIKYFGWSNLSLLIDNRKKGLYILSEKTNGMEVYCIFLNPLLCK